MTEVKKNFIKNAAYYIKGSDISEPVKFVEFHREYHANGIDDTLIFVDNHENIIFVRLDKQTDSRYIVKTRDSPSIYGNNEQNEVEIYEGTDDPYPEYERGMLKGGRRRRRKTNRRHIMKKSYKHRRRQSRRK